MGEHIRISMKPLNQTEFNSLISDFPDLSHHGREGIEFVHFDPEEANIYCGSSYVIPFISETECLVTRRANGRWVLPGGTLEPGERWLEAAHRELMEETGALLHNIAPLGMYRSISQDTQPRLPHIPHPLHVRVVLAADAKQVKPPADPDDNSKITEVRIIKYDEAFNLFSAADRDFAALYHLAYAMRNEA